MNQRLRKGVRLDRVAALSSATRRKVGRDSSREVLSVVSGVRRRRAAGEQDERGSPAHSRYNDLY